MSPEFLVTSLIVIASPGTGVLFTLAAGLARGAAASIVAAFGCTLGILPHLAAAVLGLAAVLHTSALAFQILKYLGVAYLLYMAWAAWQDRGVLRVDTDGAPRSAPRIILSAILVNSLNPKLSIFFLAFLPQFVDVGADRAVAQMGLLGALFMALTFAVFVGYGVFAAWVRRHVIGRPRILAWMRGTFAAAFVGLGVRLAVTER